MVQLCGPDSRSRSTPCGVPGMPMTMVSDDVPLEEDELGELDWQLAANISIPRMPTDASDLAAPRLPFPITLLPPYLSYFVTGERHSGSADPPLGLRAESRPAHRLAAGCGASSTCVDMPVPFQRRTPASGSRQRSALPPPPPAAGHSWCRRAVQSDSARRGRTHHSG